MARPRASELTDRELEVMQSFWSGGEQTIADARDRLKGDGRDLAYTTVATLVRILVEKGFLKQTTERRPHLFCATRSHQEVSGRLLSDLMQRVFGGSAEALITRLMEVEKLNAQERERLQALIESEDDSKSKPRRGRQ